jgi:hypothetical protein
LFEDSDIGFHSNEPMLHQSAARLCCCAAVSAASHCNRLYLPVPAPFHMIAKPKLWL